MAKKVMLIGAGGVAGVAAAKMAQNPDTFGELLIASRTKARCDAIKADIERRRDSWFATRDSGPRTTSHEPRTSRPRRSTRWMLPQQRRSSRSSSPTS